MYTRLRVDLFYFGHIISIGWDQMFHRILLDTGSNIYDCLLPLTEPWRMWVKRLVPKHNKPQESMNHVHNSWDVLYISYHGYCDCRLLQCSHVTYYWVRYPILTCVQFSEDITDHIHFCIDRQGSTNNILRIYSLRRRRLICRGIYIINLTMSQDRLRFIMGAYKPVRGRLLDE